MKIHLEKGRTSLSLDIPDEKVADVLLGTNIEAVAHELLLQKVADSLEKELPADIAEKKVALIIPDDTRLWARGDLFVPVIVEGLLAKGVAAPNISIIIALGTHGDMPEDRFHVLAGGVENKGVKILNSANADATRLVSKGETTRKTALLFTKEAVEADHIVLFGGVLHHMLAGYGGGRKYVFPGIAGYTSIQQNHSLAMMATGAPHPEVRQARLDGNPVHEDMQEACDIFLRGKGCTSVTVAVNGKGELFHADVGKLAESFSRSCRELDRACCLPLEKKRDFALISAGGYRADGQLYQSTKALFNGVNAVKEGGHILFVAECSEGAGNRLFLEALTRYRRDPETLGRRLVTSFDMPSYVAYRVIDLLHRFTITLVSGFDEEQTRALGFEFFENLENYGKNLTGKGYIIPFAENILPIVQEIEENT